MTCLGQLANSNCATGKDLKGFLLLLLAALPLLSWEEAPAGLLANKEQQWGRNSHPS